jgi:hypothetical protein
MRRRFALAGIAASLLASVFAGCNGTPTPGLSNGSVSACYRAIPTARHAIHDSKATLIGVHRIPADRVRARLPASAESRLAADNDTTVCAIAFHGKFAPGQVDLASPHESGPYAIVLVSSKKLHLIGTAVLSHLPRALGRRFV